VIGVFSDVRRRIALWRTSVAARPKKCSTTTWTWPKTGGGERGFERCLEKDIRRNHSKDIVILINRGTFHGHEGYRLLAHMLDEELPEHRSFEYTYRAVEGRIAFLEWAYEDYNVRVRDGADSYLIENGKIVAQTIHYTVEHK
jgi:hypothetical protein